MRNKLKNLVIFTFILVTFSCTNDIGINTNEQINDNTEIINDLKTNLIKDIDFNEIVNINYQFSGASIQKIKKYIINNGKINEPFDDQNYEEIFVVIGIDDLYNEHISNLKMLTQKIRTRYPNIDLLSRDDVESLFKEVKNQNKISLFLQSKIDSCDDAFEAAFHALHAQYDLNVGICTVISLFTAGIATPCYVVAVGKAIVDATIAIENHARCKQNN